MSVLLHALLTVITAGVFVPIWFSWARQWLDTLVPGLRIPRWGPGVSLVLSLMTLVAGLLVFLPIVAMDVVVFELVVVMCVLGAANGIVVTIMAMRAREILLVYSEERLPIVYDITAEWTLGLTSQQLQHHINTLSLIDEWEPAGT
jgi:uncharacterized membrane protein YjgN (DUF898 family)